MSESQHTAPAQRQSANSGCLQRLVRRVFFTMVQHPKYGWIRVGKAYASKKSAQEWVPFVRSYWRGLRTKVVSCTLRFVDGKLTAASAKTLDVKFNMAPPDNLEITSGERTAIELANNVLEVSAGFDDCLDGLTWCGGDDWTAEEKRELSDHMIGLWTRFKEVAT